jgi:phage terminase large subunit-like protein
MQARWISHNRVDLPPPLDRIVVGVEPPMYKTAGCGIVAVGIKARQLYVLGDMSAPPGSTTAEWAHRVAVAFHTYGANCVAAAQDQGGDMLRAIIHQSGSGSSIPVSLHRVTASTAMRIAKIQAMYADGFVSHVGEQFAIEADLLHDRRENRTRALEAAIQNLTAAPAPRMRQL